MGWVEHDPQEIWRDVLHTAREVIAKSEARVAAIGIANQRETTVVWERATGSPVCPAIVWQDRRTAHFCERLRQDGCEDLIRSRTGLLLDPYFSATKLAWILDHVPGARARAESDELCFGTIDSFLLWRLTGGKMYATDAQTRPGPCCSISTGCAGMRIFCGCSIYPKRSSPRFMTTALCTGPQRLDFCPTNSDCRHGGRPACGAWPGLH